MEATTMKKNEDWQLVSYRLPAPLYRRLKVAAAVSGRTMQDIVTEALEHYLPKMEG